MSAGDKNAYWCADCHRYIVTVDVDDGTTPMFLACRVLGEPTMENPCKGTMRSMMYAPQPWPERDGYGVPIPTEPTHEWYSPGPTERKRLRRDEPFVSQHVENGGLLLRRLDDDAG